LKEIIGVEYGIVNEDLSQSHELFGGKP
jgi:hypothetical protein